MLISKIFYLLWSLVCLLSLIEINYSCIVFNMLKLSPVRIWNNLETGKKSIVTLSTNKYIFTKLISHIGLKLSWRRLRYFSKAKWCDDTTDINRTVFTEQENIKGTVDVPLLKTISQTWMKSAHKELQL